MWNVFMPQHRGCNRPRTCRIPTLHREAEDRHHELRSARGSRRLESRLQSSKALPADAN